MRKFVDLAILTAAIVLVASFASAASAQAGEFTKHRCNDMQPGEDLWWEHWSVSAWGKFGEGCPDPIVIQLAGGYIVAPGEYPLHSQHDLGGIPLVRASVTMSGSNGLEFGARQGIRFCGDTCSPIHIRSSENQDVPETLEFSVEDGTIPHGAHLIVLAADCTVQEGCGGGDWFDQSTWQPALNVHDIELVYLDDVPPQVDVYVAGTDPLQHRFGWLSGDVHHSTQAGDYETGVVYTWTTLGPDNTIIYECGHPDATEPTETCPDREEYYDPVIPQHELLQGVNQLHAFARDVVGNEGSTVKTFKFDSIPPNRPSGVVIKPGRSVWVNDLNATIEWNNTGETVQTAQRSGIYAARIDIDPIDPGLSDPPATVIEVDAIDEAPIRFPSNGSWTVSVETIDRAGNTSPTASLPVEVDTEKPGTASFAPLAAITAEDRINGRTIDWSWTTFGWTGICGSAFDINGLSTMNPGDDPDNPTVVGDASERTLTTGQIDAVGDGLKYVHVRAFSCAGRAGEVEREPIQVDTTSPTVRIEPADGWLNPGESARLVAEDESAKGEQSGVEAIEYSIAGATTRVDGASVSVDAPAGVNQIAFKAIDAVGNESEEQHGTVRVDDQAPDAWLHRPQLEDPTLARATAQDPESGVKAIWMEMKPTNGGPSLLLGEKYFEAAPSTAPVSIDRRIPDDALAAAGTFVVEVHAVDATGKRSVSRVWQDGSSAEVSIPLRPRPVIDVEIGRESFGFSKVHLAPFGAQRTLRGRVLLPGGGPASGVALDINVEQQGRAKTKIDRVTTAPDGSFSYGVSANSSRRLVASFAGSLRFGPATSAAELKVSSGVRLNPTRRRVRGGRTLTVRGRVLTGDAAIPSSGKLIALRYKLGRRWSSQAPSFYTFDDGSFAIPFKYKPRRKATRITFRVIVLRESGWPFERGRSREFSVVFSR